jgi:hypothetical protein
MNNKPNIPEEVIFGTKQFSHRTEGKVNFWLLFAMVTGAASDLLFHSKLPYGLLRDNHQDWPVMLRAVIELIPVFASLLWARSMVRRIRGMDELHRRITLEAWLFAAIATLFFVSIWPLLDGAGVSAAVLQATYVHLEVLDKPNFPLTLGMLWLFYFLGHSITNRGYK